MHVNCQYPESMIFLSILKIKVECDTISPISQNLKNIFGSVNTDVFNNSPEFIGRHSPVLLGIFYVQNYTKNDTRGYQDSKSSEDSHIGI